MRVLLDVLQRCDGMSEFEFDVFSSLSPLKVDQKNHSHAGA